MAKISKVVGSAIIFIGLISAVLASPSNNFFDIFNALFSTQTATASATVNAFVETSITNSTVTFGSLDPGSQNNTAASNPTQITNTVNSNTAIDIYLQATDLTSGGNSIPVANLKVAQTGSGTKTVMVEATANYLNGNSANNGYYENVAVGNSADFHFFLTVPNSQAAGVYSGTVTIKSVQDGQAPTI